MTGRRRRRRCKQVLDDLKEKRGYWKLKEGSLGRNLWKEAKDLWYDRLQNKWTLLPFSVYIQKDAKNKWKQAASGSKPRTSHN